MENLTKKQKEVYQVVVDFQKEKGYWPTYRELKEILGLKSSAGPYKYLKILHEKGYIEKTHGKARLIRLRKPIDKNSQSYSDLTEAKYWLIEIQKKWVSFEAVFYFEGFEKTLDKLKINIHKDEHQENINKIISEYNNLTQE